MAETVRSTETLRTWPDLAAVRRSRGITLDQIAESTKLSKRYLEAIEEARFELLPGGIFNTSYIRQYARAIDYDEDELIAYYKQEACAPAFADGSASDSRKKPVQKSMRLPLVSARP